jgi:threonine dehydratase
MTVDRFHCDLHVDTSSNTRKRKKTIHHGAFVVVSSANQANEMCQELRNLSYRQEGWKHLLEAICEGNITKGQFTITAE